MSHHDLLINVGDLVYDERQAQEGLGVVIDLEPRIQTAHLLESTGSSEGLQLALPGSSDPIAVVGSLPLPEVARGLMQSSEFYGILGYDFILQALYLAAKKGPVSIEALAA